MCWLMYREATVTQAALRPGLAILSRRDPKATSFPSLGRSWIPLPMMERDAEEEEEEAPAPSPPQQPRCPSPVAPLGMAGGTMRPLLPACLPL